MSSLGHGKYHSAVNTGWGFIHSDSPFAFNIEDRKQLHQELPDLTQVTPNQTWFKYYRQKRDKLAGRGNIINNFRELYSATTGRGEPQDTVELEGAPTPEQEKEIQKNSKKKQETEEGGKEMKPDKLANLLKLVETLKSKPVKNPMAGKGCRGGRFIKGSKEAKEYMARLRSMRGKGSYNKAAIKGGSSYNKAAIKGGSLDIDPAVLKDYIKVYGEDFVKYAMSEKGQSAISALFDKIKGFFGGRTKKKQLQEYLDTLKSVDPEKWKKIMKKLMKFQGKQLLPFDDDISDDDEKPPPLPPRPAPKLLKRK